MRGIYGGDVFLPSDTATRLSEALYKFIRAYMYLASCAYTQNVAMFALWPKLHALHEVGYLLAKQATECSVAMNPAVHTCSCDEDFVGRTAALSRCVSPKVIAKRTLSRYLVHIQCAWARS